MFLAIITMSMILKKQTNLFSNDYNSFISLVSLVTKVISRLSLSIERHSYTGCCYRTGNECLEVIVGTPAALGELKVLIAKLFEYEN